jgi:hypothetical protein
LNFDVNKRLVYFFDVSLFAKVLLAEFGKLI